MPSALGKTVNCKYFVNACSWRQWASQVVLVVKNLSASTGDMRDMIQSLCQENPLEKEMETHSSIFWESPWTEEPGGLQSTGLQRVRHN